ncbi:MAG: radical SAM protein [Proteobacteria bacterium]|nr:MAG: radical SAM protein [Pseudomonadota bacterium]PIE67786.1 MAG: radical SAM protein [Deltaproteobacteria bacterium]
MLLISPPVTKPGEPPAGIAKLAGALRGRGIDCRVWDANLDCLLDLLNHGSTAQDTWTRRALAHRQKNMDGLRSPNLYRNRDGYKRAVMEINRLLQVVGRSHGAAISLSNFKTGTLSPVRSKDLIQAAEHHRSNPFYTIFSTHITEIFKEREPDILGLSINFMSQALCAFAMIGHIRCRYPRTQFVAGGGLVTSWMKIPGFGNPFAGLIDELVCGPGENRLLELCTGKTAENRSITGSDFSGCEWDAYLSPLRVLPYSTSNGCYWKKCAFCPEKAENAAYQTSGSQAIGKNLKQLTDLNSAGLIHFLDNALSPRFMQHLIEKPIGLPWYGFARITDHLADREFVSGLNASGCVMLKLGVESGDQRVLDALNKGIDIGTVSRALNVLRQAGIAAYVYLLFGTPAEDESSALRTLAFTVQHAHCIDFLNLAIFNLPAYSSEAKHLETKNFYGGDLSLYREFVHPKGWDRNRVRTFLSKAFKKQAAIRRVLNNDPPFFTSNHAAFFRLFSVAAP